MIVLLGFYLPFTSWKVYPQDSMQGGCFSKFFKTHKNTQIISFEGFFTSLTHPSIKITSDVPLRYTTGRFFWKGHVPNGVWKSSGDFKYPVYDYGHKNNYLLVLGANKPIFVKNWTWFIRLNNTSLGVCKYRNHEFRHKIVIVNSCSSSSRVFGDIKSRSLTLKILYGVFSGNRITY